MKKDFRNYDWKKGEKELTDIILEDYFRKLEHREERTKMISLLAPMEKALIDAGIIIKAEDGFHVVKSGGTCLMEGKKCYANLDQKYAGEGNPIYGFTFTRLHR